jgi:hypothetical protein
MKNSEAYHLAQIAVINSPSISPENKVEILKVLISDESLAKYTEKNHAGKTVEE